MSLKIFHERKLLEYALANCPELKESLEKELAVTDYNIMMGNLLDPSEENNNE